MAETQALLRADRAKNKAFDQTMHQSSSNSQVVLRAQDTESQALLPLDQVKNMAFDKILHKSSSNSQGGLRAMINKDNEAHKAAVAEYFQHWDDKKAEDETEAVRQSRVDDYASLTRQYEGPFPCSLPQKIVANSGCIKQVLQLGDRSLRIWLGRGIPLLQIFIRGEIWSGRRSTRTLSSKQHWYQAWHESVGCWLWRWRASSRNRQVYWSPRHRFEYQFLPNQPSKAIRSQGKAYSQA